IGFSFAVLIVATILVEKNTLAIILTAIAAAAVYVLRRPVKRNKSILLMIVGVWILCVSIQRFAVPYIFKHIMHPYQVERIMNTFGVEYIADENTRATSDEKKREDETLKKQK